MVNQEDSEKDSQGEENQKGFIEFGSNEIFGGLFCFVELGTEW